MSDENALDKFGKLVMKDLRDSSISYFDKLIEGKWKAPSLQNLQNDLKIFNEDQINIIRRALVSSLDTGIHDFLFRLQNEEEDGVIIEVNGQNLAELSDGLNGELFTEDGWYHRFSEYGENEE
ncbi:hypothetical protein RB620_29865 [Paenibacillus sp. LHD-117]|uniref:hypothetical protein n=1 Tax=Paenibacillus sp. LHD-117 TaxID=3071412 RepID=UPI0027DEDF07|nr:hypothetical protein [Paenibacillus sp. LHD-117]MDQ6423622.1 hypothetical protein [Paenibacillus sp. LHD-117]